MINVCPKCGGDNIIVQGLETYCMSAVGPEFHQRLLADGTKVSLSDKCLYHFNLYERVAYSEYLFRYQVEPRTLPVDRREFRQQEKSQRFEEERLKAHREIEKTRARNRKTQRTYRNKEKNQIKIKKRNARLYQEKKESGELKRKSKSARVLSEQRPLTLGLI